MANQGIPAFAQSGASPPGVASIILGHHHPSREDLRLTKQLVEAGQRLDLTVHDHVILGAGDAYGSFADRGLL